MFWTGTELEGGSFYIPSTGFLGTKLKQSQLAESGGAEYEIKTFVGPEQWTHQSEMSETSSTIVLNYCAQSVSG